MVEHIVVFKWKPDTLPEAIDAVVAGLQGLRSKIPGIIDLTCGHNYSDRSQGFGLGLVVRFQNRASLEAYGPHPLHQEVVQNLIMPIREDIIVVDYDISYPA